jgi:hypothetical protein
MHIYQLLPLVSLRSELSANQKLGWEEFRRFKWEL